MTNDQKEIIGEAPKRLVTTGNGLIEIDHGSAKLEYFLDRNQGVGVKVLIEADINDIFGVHDGVGQEFCMAINSLKILGMTYKEK